MRQLPIFITLEGQTVILLGDGEAAMAKRRLIERAGGVCVDSASTSARLAFVALDDASEAERISAQLKQRRLLVNVVDRPDLCDFTTPAIIDRDPVLIAIGTGGASAGLAKAIRQRLETMLPQSLGRLAEAMFAVRDSLRLKITDLRNRRQAIDDAFAAGGPLDPFADNAFGAVGAWLEHPDALLPSRLETIQLTSNDPDQLTLRAARLLGSADLVCADAKVCDEIVNRARADAVRQRGKPPQPLPAGLTVYLRIQDNLET